MNRNSVFRSGFASLGVWFDESEPRDSVLIFDEKKVIKGMERGSVLYNVDSSIAHNKRDDEITQEVLDLKQSHFESEKIQAQNDLSVCEDYLLDIEFSESITNLDYGSTKGLLNPILESQIPLSSCDETDSCGIPYSSRVIAQEAQSHNAIFGLTNSELHDLSRDKCEGQMLVDYNSMKFPTSFAAGDISTVDDVAGFFAEAVASEKLNDSMIDQSALLPKRIPFLSNGTHNECQDVGRESFDMHETSAISCPVTSEVMDMDPPITQKRLRKPTRRYIVESSDISARRSKIRGEVYTCTSEDKPLKVRCQKKSRSESMEMDLFPEDSSCEAIQVPFASLVNEECHERPASNVIQVIAPKVLKSDKVIAPKVLKSDKAAAVVSPEVDAVALKKVDQEGVRRKHHRLWTVSEVRKLIDGVALHGVGRWSHIKKLFFSSSVHRTPVDLKDKWRNLLKACYLQQQSKISEKGKHNVSWRPLPKSVLHRVSELANMHPYPRNRRCRSPQSSSSPSSSPRHHTS